MNTPKEIQTVALALLAQRERHKGKGVVASMQAAADLLEQARRFQADGLPGLVEWATTPDDLERIKGPYFQPMGWDELLQAVTTDGGCRVSRQRAEEIIRTRFGAQTATIFERLSTRSCEDGWRLASLIRSEVDKANATRVDAAREARALKKQRAAKMSKKLLARPRQSKRPDRQSKTSNRQTR